MNPFLKKVSSLFAGEGGGGCTRRKATVGTWDQFQKPRETRKKNLPEAEMTQEKTKKNSS
jgi:hypothetical protein